MLVWTPLAEKSDVALALELGVALGLALGLALALELDVASAVHLHHKSKAQQSCKATVLEARKHMSYRT